MAKVVDGTNLSLPAVAREVAELQEQIGQLTERLSFLQQVLEFAEAESAGGSVKAPRPPRKRATARTAAAQRAIPARREGLTTRQMILVVLSDVPPGATITTDELLDQLADQFDHTPALDTLRRSAQRMADRGELIRLDSGVWQTLPSPAAGDTTR